MRMLQTARDARNNKTRNVDNAKGLDVYEAALNKVSTFSPPFKLSLILLFEPPWWFFPYATFFTFFSF